MLSPLSALNANDPYEQLIAQIIRLERQPQQALQARKAEQQRFKDVLGMFDSKLSALHTQLKGFTDTFSNPFSVRAVTQDEAAAFRASAGASAALGTHTLNIQRLARADHRVSQRLDTNAADLRSFFDANGAQTFSMEVAAPTDADPQRREHISVTVDPTGASNGEILDEIATAIDDAMRTAAEAGTIRSTERVAASVLHETSDTARLSLRSGASGYANRLAFTDSSGGLLALLEVDRQAVVAGAGSTPATPASVTGSSISGPFQIENNNRNLDLTINGATVNAQIAKGTYNTIDDLAAAIGDAVGNDVTVGVDGDTLRFETNATGASSSLQITGGNALGTLGLQAMAEPVYGADATQTGGDTRGGMMVDVGTSEIDSALNSVFILDGLTHYRSTNSVTDALEGVTVELRQVSEAEESFTVGIDEEAARVEVESFVEKYNEVLDFIFQKSQVDAEAGTRGDFAGERTITGLRYAMRNAVVSPVAGQPAGFALSDLGLTIKGDGTLELTDPEALTAKVEEDADAVQRLFGNADGLATRLTTRLDTFLGVEGLIDSREGIIDQRIRRLDDRIGGWDERLLRRENQLREQFAHLQEMIASFEGQQQIVSGFFGGF